MFCLERSIIIALAASVAFAERLQIRAWLFWEERRFTLVARTLQSEMIEKNE